LRDERLVQLAPHRRVASLKPAMRADLVQPVIADDPGATLQAVSFYETAAHAFRDGGHAQRPALARIAAGRSGETGRDRRSQPIAKDEQHGGCNAGLT
jgi:hypothetical protein